MSEWVRERENKEEKKEKELCMESHLYTALVVGTGFKLYGTHFDVNSITHSRS